MAPAPGRCALRVLIVDDNRDAADTLACLLELRGFDPRVAYDGPDGLRQAAAWPPDCVVSDVIMPGLDGYALARAVRADPALAGVRLVALSALGDAGHARRAAEAGFDHVFTKAADPADLLEVLRMMEEIKALAAETHKLAGHNAELAGQTRDLLREVKADVREVKEEVKELKQEVKELKADRRPEPGGP